MAGLFTFVRPCRLPPILYFMNRSRCAARTYQGEPCLRGSLWRLARQGVERVTVMWRRGQRVTVAARKQGSGQYVVATLRSGGSQGRRAFKGVTVAARKQGVTVAARKKQGSGWAVDRG